VVVTRSLADGKGVVRINLRFSTSEAAESGSGALISRSQLAVAAKARGKYEEATRRMAKHDAEGATRLLQEAFEIAPGFAAAWNSLGVIAYQHSEYESAERNFRKAVEADPTAFDARVNLGGVLLNLNRAQDALPFNEKAAQQRPKDALANAQLGMNYFALGQADRAEEYLKAAENIDPSHFTQPQWFLAAIYVSRGDREAAIQELNRLIERHPDGESAERARRQIARLEGAGETAPGWGERR